MLVIIKSMVSKLKSGGLKIILKESDVNSVSYENDESRRLEISKSILSIGSENTNPIFVYSFMPT